MYDVYDEKGNPYTTVYNEEEADYIAFCIGGYVKNIRNTQLRRVGRDVKTGNGRD